MIIGIGIDLVKINRIESMVIHRIERLAYKILTSNELLKYHTNKQKVRFLAKRLAAKEAGAKALGTGIYNGLTFSQFEVINDALGKPSLFFLNKAAILAKNLGVTNIFITLTDEQDYACATVILER